MSSTGFMPGSTAALVHAWVAGTLPKAEWTHEAHLRVGLWHVATLGPVVALSQLRQGITRYNESVGTANTDSSGYHETLTSFYVDLIARFLDQSDRTQSLDALASALVDRYGDRDLALRVYSRDRLFSTAARRGWLPPDLVPAPAAAPSLVDRFGDIDIYLFDQLLRGRIAPGMRVLDAGCGGGRNLVYLLRSGYDVAGVDEHEGAVARTRALAAVLSPQIDPGAFRVEPIESMSFPAASFDAVVASAVFHFARDPGHFERMLRGAWRVLRPGGVFFVRLASKVGMSNDVRALGDGRFILPDGTERYLVTVESLIEWTTRLGGDLLDPIKTTVVHNQRAMTTWVTRRR